MSTGMTWEDVREQFDIPRVKAMQEYWATFPPAHVAIAHYLGYGKKTEEKARPPSDAELAELLAMIPEVPRG